MTTTSGSIPSNTGHRARLRERFERDPAGMADYEVLELLLGYSLTRKDTKPLAKELLRRFGGIRGVMDARPDELLAVPGFGPGLMTFFTALRETYSRYTDSAVRKREVLATPQAVARMAQSRLAGCPHEECWLALVDQRNRLTAWERLRQGGVAEGGKVYGMTTAVQEGVTEDWFRSANQQWYTGGGQNLYRRTAKACAATGPAFS